MNLGEKRFALVGLLSLSLLLASSSGCGKNVVGPKSPSLSADADELSEAEVLQNYSAACHNPSRWIGPRGWVYEFIMNCTPAKILKMGDDVSDGYFSDPAVLKTVRRITTSPLFYIIMFKHGVGFLLTDMAAQIISTGWSPKAKDNPGDFPNKVTLFPFDWNTYKLFHGSLNAGWTRANNYYMLQMTSAGGNTLFMQTATQGGDIYQNQVNFNDFMWDYQCQLVNSHSAYLNNRLTRSLASNWVYMDGRGNWMAEDGEEIRFDDIHFSTLDKSGRCHITSAPDNKINLELNFNADGSGAGNMDIKDVHGKVIHYEYSQAANGHGWWTKNQGKKHCF